MSITYGDLEKVLLSLGFEKKQIKRSVIYIEKKNDAVISFLEQPQNALVSPQHLSLAKTQISGRGVAELADFEAALEKIAV
jgi:hypothetical protein